MSYIPDCRTDEFYNEKYLDDKDTLFVRGFDWCAEMAADMFFDNLPSEIEDLLAAELPESMREEYDVKSDFDTNETPQHRTVNTWADLMRKAMLDFIESERDELITSMIDGMDEAEYKAIKERVDNGRTAEGKRQASEKD